MSLYQSEYEVKISFEDLDPMNIVWHGNYMRYMEQARCDMLDKLNYTYTDMRDDGYAYPVAKMNVKYIKPAEFGDILMIKSEIVSVEPSLDIKYVVFNKKTGEKIFEASTMQIGIDTQTRKSIYTPPARLVQALERIKNEKN
ncbi:MAG: acyl-CoA thioesterase [Alphaproteobacteria bacterium]|nr:acyl-CoA thioesterase [Alphaproteobacteria bacterium]